MNAENHSLRLIYLRWKEWTFVAITLFNCCKIIKKRFIKKLHEQESLDIEGLNGICSKKDKRFNLSKILCWLEKKKLLQIRFYLELDDVSMSRRRRAAAVISVYKLPGRSCRSDRCAWHLSGGPRRTGSGSIRTQTWRRKWTHSEPPTHIGAENSQCTTWRSYLNPLTLDPGPETIGFVCNDL